MIKQISNIESPKSDNLVLTNQEVQVLKSILDKINNQSMVG